VLEGFALLSTEGHAAATPTLRLASSALAEITSDDVLRWGYVAPLAALVVWDFESMLAISTRQLQLVRDAGALAILPIPLSSAGLSRVYLGDFAGAASLVAESDGVAAVTGTGYVPYTVLRLEALWGRAGAAAKVAGAIERTAVGGEGTAAAWSYLAAAELHNGLARYEEAASAARQAAACTYDPFHSLWALPELVEAAARTGDTELANDALARLSESTQSAGTDYARGIEAKCRALLTDGAAADEHYREAIERLGRTRVRIELARAHLLYGEWLRRQNRRVDSRAQLRTAHHQLTTIGMRAFAERARHELQATGENVRKRTAETRDDLTAQERQIAELARDGLSNPDIGARLFLSPKTVEWHLHNVFTKLGIHSRRELPTALPSTHPQPIPA
jgi:ATP/maltotriose-dependent transcriptional regulator MalT